MCQIGFFYLYKRFCKYSFNHIVFFSGSKMFSIVQIESFNLFYFQRGIWEINTGIPVPLARGFLGKN